jgi:hypothetical protein
LRIFDIGMMGKSERAADKKMQQAQKLTLPPPAKLVAQVRYTPAAAVPSSSS